MPLVNVPGSADYMDWPSWGLPITNAVNDHETRIAVLEANAWVAYGSLATVLTATTTPPTMGNSTLDYAQYIQLGAHTIKAQGRITIGSTFSAGSGNYRFLVPGTPDPSRVNAAIGVAIINDSGTALRGCTCMYDTGAYFNLLVDASNLMVTHNGSGTAWAAGDWISWDVTYAV